jgi:hypothetical protein
MLLNCDGDDVIAIDEGNDFLSRGSAKIDHARGLFFADLRPNSQHCCENLVKKPDFGLGSTSCSDGTD